MRRRRGLSLLEALVTLAALALLGTMVAHLFRAGGVLQVRSQEGGRVQEALAAGLHQVVRELPEALAVYNLNGGLYVPPGTTTQAEAVIAPQPGQVSTQLQFTEVDPNKVGPLALDGFVATDPSYYRQVVYLATGDALLREVRPYDPLTGRYTATQAARAVTRVPGTTVTLSVQAVTGTAYVTGTSYRVSLRATAADARIPVQEVTAYVYVRPKV